MTSSPESSQSPTRPLFIVTGASGGIGSALCRKLSSQGARLALISRNEERLGELVRSLTSGGEPHLIYAADVTSSEQVKTTFERIARDAGSTSGVAHCVGSVLLRPAHLMRDEDWIQTLNVNLNSAFYVLRESVKILKSDPGSIVFCSSAAARIGLANHEAIAAAKAGIEGLVRSAAATYASRKIRVNAVAPGLVDTPLVENIVRNEAALKTSIAYHPLKRIGQPHEVANALAWFLDPAQSWVTGQTLAVDGGMSNLKTIMS